MRLVSILLAILMVGTAWAQSDATQSGNEQVLRVGERTLSLAEFDQRFDVYAAGLAAQQGIPLTPETRPLLAPLRPGYLEQLATQFVLLEEAGHRGLETDSSYVAEQVATVRGSFESDEDFRRGLEQAGFASEALLAELIGEAELARRTVDLLRSELTIREYQLELFYRVNLDRYRREEQVCARHILVATEDEALSLAEQLDSGADFGSLARAYSTDSGSAGRGGDLGCFPRGMMVGPFEDAAFETPVGTVSDIVKSRFGFHLVLPYDRKEASQVPLDQVKDEVRTEVENLALTKLIENLESAADVEVNAALVGPDESQEEELEKQ